jgi:hypothetical protein
MLSWLLVVLAEKTAKKAAACSMLQRQVWLS